MNSPEFNGFHQPVSAMPQGAQVYAARVSLVNVVLDFERLSDSGFTRSGQRWIKSMGDAHQEVAAIKSFGLYRGTG
jgi:hypothetical protein